MSRSHFGTAKKLSGDDGDDDDDGDGDDGAGDDGGGVDDGGDAANDGGDGADAHGGDDVGDGGGAAPFAQGQVHVPSKARVSALPVNRE